MKTLQELLASLTDISGLSDEELAEALSDLQNAAATAGTDDEVLDLLDQAADLVDAIKAEQTSRVEAAAQREARAQAALERIQGQQEEDEDEEPQAEEEPEGDKEDEDEAEAVTEEAPAEERVPVAAGAGVQLPGKGVVSAVKARRLPERKPSKPVGLPARIEDWGLHAAANAPGLVAGARIKTNEQLARAVIAAYKLTLNTKLAPNARIPLFTKGWTDGREMYGEDRFLTGDVAGNLRKIDQVVNRQSTSRAGLAAAGGICAPVPQTYDMPILGTDSRPVRDQGMVRFGADRGGVSTMPIPSLSDVSGAVSVWTEANDQNPSSPTTKPCLTITCPEEEETVVDAIVRCIQAGNFRARYFPEQVEAWMRLTAVQHARIAEQRLISTIDAGSTEVTVGQVLGTTRDVLAALDRAIAGQQSFHRDYDTSLTYVMPAWLRRNIATDLARQLPVGTVEETLAVADATIDRIIGSRVDSVVWSPDINVFAQQADGALIGWPSTVNTYLYPTGTWLFLDGGGLDLGLTRDSTLNSTNDVQFFAETFEAAHFHGIWSEELLLDICPDGSVSATIDINPCTLGS